MIRTLTESRLIRRMDFNRNRRRPLSYRAARWIVRHLPPVPWEVIVAGVLTASFVYFAVKN